MFYGLDTRKLFWIVIAIMLIRGIFSFDEAELLSTLLILPGLILGITVHEYSHARMSDKLGDPTPENQGRLTLNPLRHLDLVGTICLLFAGFGWGKPVEIDPTYYRNPAKDSMKVALAGPVSNFIIAFVLFFIYALVALFVPISNFSAILITCTYLGAYINLSLGVFNLLPFPPLDGSKIWGYFLKGKAKEFLWKLEKYSTIILIILYMTELPSLIITPAVTGIATGMTWIIEKILSLFI